MKKPTKLITPIALANFKETKNPMISEAVVKVMYPGENRNGSYISRELAESMANSSLRGCPVVGHFLAEQGDFGDHSEQIGFDESTGQIVKRTLTKPYGFVPTDAKVWWENIKDASGNIREYLCTNVYLWTGRYPEVRRVVESNQNNQSMELDPAITKGDWSRVGNNPREIFVIRETALSALCILGADVEPCFEDAAFDSNFSLDKDTAYESEWNVFMKELAFALDEKVKEEGDKKMEFADGSVIQQQKVALEQVIQALDALAQENPATAAIVDELIDEVIDEGQSLEAEQPVAPQIPNLPESEVQRAEPVTVEDVKKKEEEEAIRSMENQVVQTEMVEKEVPVVAETPVVPVAEEVPVVEEKPEVDMAEAPVAAQEDDAIVNNDELLKKLLQTMTPEELGAAVQALVGGGEEAPVDETQMAADEEKPFPPKAEGEEAPAAPEAAPAQDAPAEEAPAAPAEGDKPAEEEKKLKNQIQSFEAKVAELETELATLREFKLGVEREEKVELLNKFSLLGDEFLGGLKAKADELTLEAIEAKCSVEMVRNGLSFGHNESNEESIVSYSMTNQKANAELPIWAALVPNKK